MPSSPAGGARVCLTNSCSHVLLCYTKSTIVWAESPRDTRWDLGRDLKPARTPTRHSDSLPCRFRCIEMLSSCAEEDVGRLIMWHCCIRNIDRIKHLKATSLSTRTGGRSNLSAVVFVNTTWKTHQGASKDHIGSFCLLIKTREVPVAKKMDWGKDRSFQVMLNDSRMAVSCLGQE